MKGALQFFLHDSVSHRRFTSLLANLMLPDGAERQPEDWTIFFLNQTPFSTIAPALAPEPEETDHVHDAVHEDKPELLYVLNLVRTKLDKTVRRYKLSGSSNVGC